MNISTVLRQWCRVCQECTVSVPCDQCGPPYVNCAKCGGHPDRLTGGKVWISHGVDDE